MPDTERLLDQLLMILMGWSLVWLGAAVIGLYATPREGWRAFWFMSGLWAFIDAAIAWYGLLGGMIPPEDIVPLLRLNTGLDVVYIAIGLVLLSRRTPRLRGFGWAVVVQGFFLLVLDATYWRLCAADG